MHSSAFSAYTRGSSLCLGALADFKSFVTIFKVFLCKYKVLKVAFSFSYKRGFCMNIW